MKVTIDLVGGTNGNPTKQDVQSVIDSLTRYKEGRQNSHDFIKIISAITILDGIMVQLEK